MADRKKRGLGKGLSELLGGGAALGQGVDISSGDGVEAGSTPSQLTLPVSALQPCAHQPRLEIDPVALDELAQSIREQGILQPILVRIVDGNQYEIVAGERRWRAAQIAKLTDVPVVIRQLDDEQAMTLALVENIQREDLNPIDIAVALGRLADTFSTMTHEDLARLVGKSRSAVSNFLRLLALESPVKQMLRNGDLEMGHARALLPLKGEVQVQLAKMIVDKALSVRVTENLVRQRILNAERPSSKPRPATALDSALVDYQKQLSDQLNTPVKIKAKGTKGELVIKYKDPAMLKQLCDLLCYQPDTH